MYVQMKTLYWNKDTSAHIFNYTWTVIQFEILCAISKLNFRHLILKLNLIENRLWTWYLWLKCSMCEWWCCCWNPSKNLQFLWWLMIVIMLMMSITRPKVSKLTPVNTKNSEVTKLSKAESRLKHTDRHTKTMNSFWISLQTFQECLLKVQERNLKLCRTSVETSKKFL